LQPPFNDDSIWRCNEKRTYSQLLTHKSSPLEPLHSHISLASVRSRSVLYSYRHGLTAVRHALQRSYKGTSSREQEAGAGARGCGSLRALWHSWAFGWLGRLTIPKVMPLLRFPAPSNTR